MSNMSYCRFENTSNDIQDLIDVMYEGDFNPDMLSTREKRAYDSLYDQCQAVIEQIEYLEEKKQVDEEDEREQYEEACAEELEMHRAIVGDDGLRGEDL